jgi:hypothetical protein
MLTGELRSQIDAIWNSFWSGGIAKPPEVIEQIAFLPARMTSMPWKKTSRFALARSSSAESSLGQLMEMGVAKLTYSVD